MSRYIFLRELISQASSESWSLCLLGHCLQLVVMAGGVVPNLKEKMQVPKDEDLLLGSFRDNQERSVAAGKEPP